MKKTLAAVLTASSFALALAGCSSSSLQQAAGGASSAADKAASAAGAAAASLAPVTADPALTAKLPQKIRDAGKLTVGVEGTYKPNEYLDADGKTVIGMNIEMFDAVAARLGVKAEWQTTQFASILNGVASGKYDVGSSSFTITNERMKNVNMISYMSAGTQWVVAKGNPSKVDVSDRAKLCGQKVAVQKGTTQSDEMEAVNATCPADKKIDLLIFDDQGMVTNALITNRVVAMAADSPIALYAVKENDAKIEALGEAYDSAPYGFVVNKPNTELANAIAQAVKDIKASGQYDAILAKYGMSKSAIADFQVNPTVK